MKLGICYTCNPVQREQSQGALWGVGGSNQGGLPEGGIRQAET